MFNRNNRLFCSIRTLCALGALAVLSSVAHADSKTILANMPWAENVIVASDNRVFVSAQDGLYYVPRNGGSASRIPVAFDLTSTPSTANTCFFTGLTQIGNYVYSSCTRDYTSASSPRYVLAMDLTQPLSMRAFYSVTNTGVYNGIGSDSAGRLYLAMSPGSITSGKIVRITLSAPMTVSSRVDWLSVSGKPIGLKVYGTSVYFTEVPLIFGWGSSFLKRVSINSDGSAGWPQTLYSTNWSTVTDDIALVNGGVVLTTADAYGSSSSSNNRVLHISESGQQLHASTVAFQLPSAVALERSPNAGALYVTERGASSSPVAGDVAEFFQSWGLSPRP